MSIAWEAASRATRHGEWLLKKNGLPAAAAIYHAVVNKTEPLDQADAFERAGPIVDAYEMEIEGLRARPDAIRTLSPDDFKGLQLLSSVLASRRLLASNTSRQPTAAQWREHTRPAAAANARPTPRFRQAGPSTSSGAPALPQPQPPPPWQQQPPPSQQQPQPQPQPQLDAGLPSEAEHALLVDDFNAARARAGLSYTQVALAMLPPKSRKERVVKVKAYLKVFATQPLNTIRAAKYADYRPVIVQWIASIPL